jgi:hypothetical protein
MLIKINPMSPFTPGNVPSNVNTIEELLVWAMFILAQLNPNSTVQSAAGTVEPTVSAQIIKLPNQTTDPERVVCVAYIPLTDVWRASGNIWGSGIKEISQTVIPASFTSN